MDYEDDDMENECLGKANFPNAPKTHWGEDSKSDYYDEQGQEYHFTSWPQYSGMKKQINMWGPQVPSV